MKMQELFEQLGHPYRSMTLNEPIDVSDQEMEIRSFETETGMQTWQLIRRIVRKQRTDSYVVTSPGRIEGLIVSPEHLFWTRMGGSEPHWVEAHALVDNDFELFWADGSCWIAATVQHTTAQTDILDVEVDGTHCYYTDGVLSHNTMYGDPLTTPGGNAIPFHASVRIRLGSGAKILNKDKEQIGIKVIASLVKNKVARPGRKVEFEIHFGRGIVEHEQILDVLRGHCKRHGDVVRGDKLLSLTGDSAWKTLSVANKATGEVLLEKKFQISGFGELMRDEVHGPIIHELLDGVMVIDSSRAAEADSEASESTSDDTEAPVEE